MVLQIRVAPPAAAGERPDYANVGYDGHDYAGGDALGGKQGQELGVRGTGRLIVAAIYDGRAGIDGLLDKTSGDIGRVSGGQMERIIIGFDDSYDQPPAVFFKETYIQPVARDDFKDVGENMTYNLLQSVPFQDIVADFFQDFLFRGCYVRVFQKAQPSLISDLSDKIPTSSEFSTIFIAEREYIERIIFGRQGFVLDIILQLSLMKR